ncbi:MAG: DUF6265 family protein [Candidatus Acidiferrales bacterium]
MKRIGFSGLRKGAIVLLYLLIWAQLARTQQATSTQTGPGAKSGSVSASSPAAGKSTVIPTAEASSATQLTATAQHPTLDQFSWIEGQWRGEWGARIAEQTWLEPKAGEMAGLFRVIEGQKTLVLELFSIVEKPDGIQFFLRHLTPELLPWEKSDATALKLESVDATKATFLNPVNGEPKRLIFTRLDADTFTSRSEIEPAEGEPQVIEITFHRQKPPAVAANAGSAGRRKKP